MSYQFNYVGSNLHATRTEPIHEGTQGLFVNEDTHGYGATGVSGDWTQLPVHALDSYDFFEYLDGASGKYYRVRMADIKRQAQGGRPANHEVLDVRHRAWPGMDRREIEIERQKRIERSIAKAIQREKDKRAAAEAERLRREQEALDRQDVETEMDTRYGTEEEQIAAALKAAFPDDAAQ